VGEEGWDEAVWAHNLYDYHVQANRLKYDLHVGGNRQVLADHAIQYRLDHPTIGGDDNIAVLQYSRPNLPDAYIVLPNGVGVHSEDRVLTMMLQTRHVPIDRLVALYTERTPCNDICQPNLGSLGECEKKVCWSFDYDVDRHLIAGQIDAVIARLRGA